MEVRNITQRIEILTERLDAASSLGEPRENSFLTCDFRQKDCIEQIENHLHNLGRVRTSTTFPSLCTAALEGEVISGIENYITLKTVDYHGNPQKTGGDPIQAELSFVTTDQNSTSLPVRIVDCEDGTYRYE